jgi:hypothetical protein
MAEILGVELRVDRDNISNTDIYRSSMHYLLLSDNSKLYFFALLSFNTPFTNGVSGI